MALIGLDTSSWLSNSDIKRVLEMAIATPNGYLSRDVIQNPSSGTVVFYDRRHSKFRMDGVEWDKRKDGRSVREDHVKIKIDGIECIYVCYVRSSSLHRRSYWLLQHKDVVMSHYLNPVPGLHSDAPASFPVPHPPPYSNLSSSPVQADITTASHVAPAIDMEQTWSVHSDITSQKGGQPGMDTSWMEEPLQDFSSSRMSPVDGMDFSNDIPLLTDDQWDDLSVSFALPEVSLLMLTIDHYAPTWAFQNGGCRILIIGNFSATTRYTCRFGAIVVAATIVREGVLSCTAPRHPMGSAALSVESLSAQSPAVPFDFVPGSLELLQSLGDDSGDMFSNSPVSKNHPGLISLDPIDQASPVQPTICSNPSVDRPAMDTTTTNDGAITSQCNCDKLQSTSYHLLPSGDSVMPASSTVSMPSSYDQSDTQSSSVLCMVCCKKSVNSADSSSKVSAMCETCGGSGEAVSPSLSRCASEKSLKDITWQDFVDNELRAKLGSLAIAGDSKPARSDRLHYSAARTIQHAFRRYRDSRERRSRRAKENAALLIQKTYRQWRQHQRMQEMNQAAIKIQHKFRAYQERQHRRTASSVPATLIADMHEAPSLSVEQRRAAEKIVRFLRKQSRYRKGFPANAK